MHTVTLLKGPKGERTWEHSTRSSASRRAYALLELHGGSFDNFTEDRDGNFTVDASRFYTAKERRKS